MRLFDDDIFGFPSRGGATFARRPQTARSWHEPTSGSTFLRKQREEAARIAENRRRNDIVRRQEEQEALREIQMKKRRIAEEQAREAWLARDTETLRGYGFADEAQCRAALEACGPRNLKAAVKMLLEVERNSQTKRAMGSAKRGHSTTGPVGDDGDFEDASYATSSSSSSLSSSSSSSSSSSASSADASTATAEESAATINAAVRGSMARRDALSLSRCFEATTAAEASAEAEEAKSRGSLVREWRATKMLRDLPVDLIGYEEALLRLQMKLDGVTAGDVSERARAEVRAMRREAVKKIQERLDEVDRTKQWWIAQAAGRGVGGAPPAAAHAVATQA